MIKPHCSNFRVITANFLDVQIFRIIMVCPKNGMLGVKGIITSVHRIFT